MIDDDKDYMNRPIAITLLLLTCQVLALHFT